MAFPTLTASPSYPLTEAYEDTAIKSTSEAGYVHARKRYTKTRKTFQLNYRYISGADKDLLDAHILSVGTYQSFTWTHPGTSVVYTVRYGSIPSIETVTKAATDSGTYYYNVSITLVEV